MKYGNSMLCLPVDTVFVNFAVFTL